VQEFGVIKFYVANARISVAPPEMKRSKPTALQYGISSEVVRDV